MEQGETRLAHKLAAALRAIGKELAKKLAHLAKAEEEDERDALDALDWTPIAAAVESETTIVAKDGAKRALAAFDIDGEAITSQTFAGAVAWAKERSAELVGKSWDEDGSLVDNEDAEYAISDTVREDIRDAVAQALEDGDSAAELSDTIEGLGCFSAERADMIARTEIIRSHAQGQMAAMRESGVVEQKAWSTSEDGDCCDECTDNQDEGAIDLEDDFPSGDDAPPAHPRCRCVVVAVIEDAAADTEDDSDDDDESADEAAE